MESGLESTTPMLGLKRRSEGGLMIPSISNIIQNSLCDTANNHDADINTSTFSLTKRIQLTPPPLLPSPNITEKPPDFLAETMACIKAGLKWDLPSNFPSSRTTHLRPPSPSRSRNKSKSKSKSKVPNPPRKHRSFAKKQAVPHSPKISRDRPRKQPLEPERQKSNQAIAPVSKGGGKNADGNGEKETPIPIPLPMPMPTPHGAYNSFLSQTNSADQVYDVATDKTQLLFTARNYRGGGFGGVGVGVGDAGGKADVQQVQPPLLNIDRVSAFDLARPRPYVSFYGHGDLRGAVEDGIVGLMERGERRRRKEWREEAWWRVGGVVGGCEGGSGSGSGSGEDSGMQVEMGGEDAVEKDQMIAIGKDGIDTNN